MSRRERRFSWWLRGTGILYVLGGADFIARPWAATASLNKAGGPPIQTEKAGLYHALATAYMATIAALALSAAKDPGERRDLIPPLLVAKAASAGLLLYRYRATGSRGFALGAGLDAGLLGVTAALYRSL